MADELSGWSPPEIQGRSLKIVAILGDGAFATVFSVEVQNYALCVFFVNMMMYCALCAVCAI